MAPKRSILTVTNSNRAYPYPILKWDWHRCPSRHSSSELVCTNGLVAKVGCIRFIPACQHQDPERVSPGAGQGVLRIGRQRSQFKLSMESPVDDPESTLASFNRQFGLNAQEKEAVEWAWPMEMGNNMFAVVNTYTRAAQWDELSAESSFRLSRVGGNILGMLN
jgi:hypothetical protein